MVTWAVKNANLYFDQQLITFYEQMVEVANVENYASNKRIFQRDRFSYDWAKDEKNKNYRLKVGHRMVLEKVGGLSRRWSSDKPNLDARAAAFICDMLVVAWNLGYVFVDQGPQEGDWEDSGKKLFRFQKPSSTELEVLAVVRTFQNSNTHVQFYPEFIHALNTQHGKLKGWLRNDAQAAEELEIPSELASRLWERSFRLEAPALRLMEPA